MGKVEVEIDERDIAAQIPARDMIPEYDTADVLDCLGDTEIVKYVLDNGYLSENKVIEHFGAEELLGSMDTDVIREFVKSNNLLASDELHDD